MLLVGRRSCRQRLLSLAAFFLRSEHNEIVPLLAAAVALSLQSSTIGVYPNEKLQKWDGWGTSLAWWAYVVGSEPDDVREDVMQRLFGYLKLNIVRYNIGGGENPEHHHMQYRAQMPGFLGPDRKWDWTADAGQRWVLQRAKEMGADRFESFSNSPPYWMTISGCASGNRDGTDNLRPDMVDAFADYLVQVNEHFRSAWGIHFETLEPLNEPSGNWWKFGGRQEGCPVKLGPNQSRVLEALGRALAKAHSRTRIAASDESDIDTAVRAFDALSPKAKSLVWRVNTHHYGGSKQRELHDHVTAVSKRLWMSEEGDKDPTGLTMAERIVRDIREMKPSAWIYWQAIDQSGSNWGFVDMDLNGRKPGGVVHKKLFAYANFSRFIPEGSTLISIDDASSIAATTKAGTVIVTVNNGPERHVRYDLVKIRRAKSVRAFRTSPTEDLVELPLQPIARGTLETSLPANSITTLVVR